MDEEASDELVGGERHGLVAVFALGTVVLPPEGDLVLIEGDETGVGDGDPVGVTRQVGEHRGGSGEGRAGILPIITVKKLSSVTRIIR